jgi:hypothetical protein
MSEELTHPCIFGPSFPLTFNCASAVFQDSNEIFIFTFGGIQMNIPTNQLFCFRFEEQNLNFCSTSQIPNDLTPRSSSTLTTVGNMLILFGGLDENQHCLNETYIIQFHNFQISLREVKGILPCIRINHSIRVTDGKLRIS